MESTMESDDDFEPTKKRFKSELPTVRAMAGSSLCVHVSSPTHGNSLATAEKATGRHKFWASIEV